MAVLQVLVFGFVTFACSAAGLELTQSCNYTSDSSDSRLLSTAYRPSMIQCAVYCKQIGENIFNFQDGVCKIGTDMDETGVTITTATTETTASATSSVQITATAASATVTDPTSTTATPVATTLASTATSPTTTTVASTATTSPTTTTVATTTTAPTITAGSTMTTSPSTTTPTTTLTTTSAPTTTTASSKTTLPTTNATTTTPTTVTTANPIICTSSSETFYVRAPVVQTVIKTYAGVNVTRCMSNNKNISFIASQYSQVDALAICLLMSLPTGLPVSLDTSTKDQFVQRMIKYVYSNTAGSLEFWVGGAVLLGAWRWASSPSGSIESSPYQNWCGISTPAATLNMCMTIKANNGVFCWSPVSCSTAKPFLCE